VSCARGNARGKTLTLQCGLQNWCRCWLRSLCKTTRLRSYCKTTHKVARERLRKVRKWITTDAMRCVCLPLALPWLACVHDTCNLVPDTRDTGVCRVCGRGIPHDESYRRVLLARAVARNRP
jgi:hypothetical protein